MPVAIVTGSGGLIGAETTRWLAGKGFTVVGIDNDMRKFFFGPEASTAWSVAELTERYSNYRHTDVDIRDMAAIDAIFAEHGKDIFIVVHTAAQPSHDWAARDPSIDFSVNATGTLNLLEATRKHAPDGVFIFTSTNKVYGDTPNYLPLIEGETRWSVDPSHPYAEGIPEEMSIDRSTHSVFGASKVAADVMVQEYGRYFGMKTACFRGGCLTGPGHSGAELHGFLAYLMKCCVIGRPYQIFGYKAKQVRDNIHSYDLVRAFSEFYSDPRPGEVYNMGGGRYANVSMMEAITLCEEISGRKLEWSLNDKNRIGDHIWYVSDLARFERHYPNWKITYDIRATMEAIYAGLVERVSVAQSGADRPLRIALVCNHRRFKVHFRGYPWGRELARRGHEVDLFCHADTAVLTTHVEQKECFRIIESPDLLVGAARQGWDPYCAVRRGVFLFRESKPYDIIHCLDTRLAVIWPALAYARARNIPIVSDWIDWWGRGGLIEERRPGWYKATLGGVETWFEEHYRAKLDGLSAISHALMKRAIDLGCRPESCIVINGAADMKTFAEPFSRQDARARLGLLDDDPVVCFSGLDVLIDLPLAIRTFEIVNAAIPNAKLLLVGPGPEDVKKSGVQGAVLNSIVAIGKVPYGDLPKVLPAADVFLLPYPNKIVNVGRWPNKIGDYMAVGRPTVANPVGELIELYKRHRIGKMAEETPEMMAEAVLSLLQDSKLAEDIGREARQVAETDLSWTTQIGRLEKWYRYIIEKHGRGGMAESSASRAIRS